MARPVPIAFEASLAFMPKARPRTGDGLLPVGIVEDVPAVSTRARTSGSALVRSAARGTASGARVGSLPTVEGAGDAALLAVAVGPGADAG